MSRGLWLAGCLSLLVPAVQAVMLDPAETADHWSNATVIDDAKFGDHAVRYVVPTTGPAGVGLDFAYLGIIPNADQELTFWYRFSGTGACSLMVKIMAYPFADGWQATWPVVPRAAVPQGWHRAVIDLGSQWLQWGDAPNQTARSIQFRTDATEGSELTLDIDQVVLQPKQFTITPGQPAIAAGRAGIPITVENTTDGDLTFELHAGGGTVNLTVPGHQVGQTALAAPLDSEWLRNADPLDSASLQVMAQVAGDPNSRKEVTVTVVKPIELPDHPRLLLGADKLPAIRQRVQDVEWAKASYEKMVASAESWLTKPVELPDRGGQWWHWYACKEDGTRLKTLSATEHQCPTCGKIYSGWPYDDVILDRDHNNYADGLRTLGFVYQITGDAKYLPKAAEILAAYAERYLTYPVHNIHGDPKIGGGRVGPQTLDESTWLIKMCQGADLIWNGLTDAQRLAAEQGLFRPAAEVIRQHKMSIHNIQCWKNSAVGLTGLLLGDAELVADAVTSDHGFKQQIAKGVDADGQWYEGAWGYHFYTVSALTPLAEAGERCGLGLYAYEHDGRQFKGLFDGPLNLAMPDLVLPAFNDSGTVGLHGRNEPFEVALARYGDPHYATAIDTAKRGGLLAIIDGVEPLPTPPDDAATGGNYLSAGYAILQHGKGDDATWACLKYGPHGGGHGHPDKLNLLLWHHGRQLGIDPGTAAYGVPIHQEWFRTSIAHDTLTVDEENQKPAEGQCLAYANGPQISVALADAGPIADGVDYKRGVALFGHKLVLIGDAVASDADHAYDLAWHNAGTWVSAPSGPKVGLPDKRGYMHLVGMVKASGALPQIQVDDTLQIGLAVASANGETWAGMGFGRHAKDQVTATIHRVKGKSAKVGWAIALDGGLPRVTVEGNNVVATLGGQTYRMTIDAAAGTIVAEGPEGSVEGSKP